MLGINNSLVYAGSIFLFFMLVIIIIKSRYRKFTNREFVLSFRNGKIRSEGYGGAYFVLPFIDELIVLSTTVQNLEVDAGEVITKENQDVRVNGFVVWRIESPREAYSSITGSQSSQGVMSEINKVLSRLVESIVRTTVARLNLDQVLRERGLIIDAIMTELVAVVGPMGIKINTAEIRHVEVVDQKLFNDLQEKYRQQAKLEAQKVKINTDQEIAKSAAYSEQQVKLYRASQEEASRVRELEKDRTVLQEQQKLNEQEQRRLQAVQEMEKNREASVAGINQKKLKIEAETRLIEIELEAESKKRRHILEQIEVEAAQRTRLNQAESEAIKIRAEADAEARKMRAIANKQAIEMEAEAEAFRLEKIAEATRKQLLAEAEGKKAVLLAEAEGLREKVQAQGLVNEAMIMRELVEQLPNIAASMKVGDINWLNMGGSGKDGETPLGIIPKNLLQLMTLSKSFGLDIEGLISKIRGNASQLEDKQLISLPPNLDMDILRNAELIIENDLIVGFDVDGDGKKDIDLPPEFQASTIENVMEKVKTVI